jgi:DNA polymerase III sliding clamp (beta) subunit (PCNA family)
VKVVFETATIADSVGKAARVAPTKGEAFDKASGILMELSDHDNTVILKATNLEIFYLEVVSAIEVDVGSAVDLSWRFNASLLSSMLTKLPIGSGKHVTFSTLDKEPGIVLVKSGRTTAKFRIMDAEYYPRWGAFDPDKLEVVADLGARIQQVEWAAMEDHEISYAGIHLDGKHVMATDRIRLAIAPCEAEPIYRPITIPAGVLKPVITNLRDVAVGIDEGMFLLMPDVSTQLKTRIYDREYPAVKKILDSKTWPDVVTVRKTALLEIMERAMLFAQRDRSPKMTFIIGKGEIAVMCVDADLGLLGDAIEVDGQCSHPRQRFIFTPKNVVEALNASPSESVEIFYNKDDTVQPVKIDGGSGYLALVMPRKEME